MITYHEQPEYRQDRLPITVKLDGRVVGKIIRSKGGYCYRPTGAKRTGAVFMSLGDVKRDIEGAGA